jgi:hypothetical protein
LAVLRVGPDKMMLLYQDLVNLDLHPIAIERDTYNYHDSFSNAIDTTRSSPSDHILIQGDLPLVGYGPLETSSRCLLSHTSPGSLPTYLDQLRFQHCGTRKLNREHTD